jgi:hypothetical protein
MAGIPTSPEMLKLASDAEVFIQSQNENLVFVWMGNPSSQVHIYRFNYMDDRLYCFTVMTMEWNEANTIEDRENRYKRESVIELINSRLEDPEWLYSVSDEWINYAEGFVGKGY